jgi:hypothetical protein
MLKNIPWRTRSWSKIIAYVAFYVEAVKMLYRATRGSRKTRKWDKPHDTHWWQSFRHASGLRTPLIYLQWHALGFRGCKSLWVSLCPLTLLWIQYNVKMLFYPMLPDFRTSTAFWKVPRTRPSVFLVWLEFEYSLIKYGVKHGTWCSQHIIWEPYLCVWKSFD